MKFSIFLSFVFAFIFFIQAHDLEFNLQTFYDEELPTRGQIWVGFFGTGMERFFRFNETFYHGSNHLIEETGFLVNIDGISFHWDSDSGKPLYFSYCTAVSNISKTIQIAVMNDYIESGSYKYFNTSFLND